MTSKAPRFTGVVEALEVGKPLDRQLAGGQGQAYRVTLAAGQYARIVADQQGVDVVVRLLGPDGKEIRRVDSPNGRQGPEVVSLIADAAGTYQVEVVCEDPAAPAGKYVMHLDEVRAATADDRRRVEAEGWFATAEADRRLQKADANPRALDGYQRALAVWRALGDRAAEGQALDRIGRMQDAMGHTAEALATFQQAQQTFAGLAQQLDLGRTLDFISKLQFRLGSDELAAASAQAAVDLYRKLGDPTLIAGALSNLGNAAIARGEADRAAAAYREALELAQRGGSDAESSAAHFGLGDVLVYEGQFDLALDELRQALQQMQKAQARHDEATTLVRMANVYMRQAHFAQARQVLQEALAIETDLGSDRGRAVALSSLGTVALRSGAGGAAPLYDQALELFRKVHDQQGEAASLLNLGRAARNAHNYGQALDFYDQAIALMRQIGNLPGEVQALFGSAQALHDRGDFGEAEARLDRVVVNLEQLRDGSDSVNLRTAFLATKQHYYELQIDVLMHLDQLHPHGDYAARALAVHERRRARGLLDLLTAARADVRRDADPQLLEREKKIEQEINQVANALAAAADQRQPTSALVEQQRQLLADLDGVRTTMRTKSPRFAALARPAILDLKQIQAEVVGNASVLLEYSLGEERSFLWVVPHEGPLSSHVLPPRAAIEDAARAAVNALSEHKSEARKAAFLDDVSRTLLQPVARDIAGIQRLLIVADGALEALPAAALPDPNAPPGAARPLIEQHEIVYLPSASTLDSLRRRTANRTEAIDMIAVLADPVFRADDPRLSGRPAAAPSAGPAGGWALDRAARETGREAIDRLSYTATEAEVIADLVPEVQRYVALGFAASRETVASGRLRHYRILHFATHGILDAEHPELSGLVLSLYDQNGRSQDGFLRAHEIAGLDLPAELVVLSACETGLGASFQGEGLGGLARAFMDAGAPRVVVSLWQVNDRGTAELMRHFYQGLFKDRLRPAAALRQAQRAMIADKTWSDPFYWAPFVYQGDWRLPSDEPGGSIENPPQGSQVGGRADLDLPPPPRGRQFLVGNGVNGSTGTYLADPTVRRMADDFRGSRLDERQQREYLWQLERFALDDPDRAPMAGVDPRDLASAGWGVVFAPDVPAEHREALQPLLTLREEQAKGRFRTYEYQVDQTRQTFLAAQGAGPGPADPRLVPYYLLLVGSPSTVPYRFQYELDFDYAVGRLHFESADEYANYAAGVLAAERAISGPAPGRHGVTLFGVSNPDDATTARTTAELIQPLGEALAAADPAWRPSTLLRDAATRAALQQLLRDPAGPALVFTASHGMTFPDEPERIADEQGAILCQDWPGPVQWTEPIARGHYLAAEDVPCDADLRGLISFHFACFSAGTPDLSNFDFPVLSIGRQSLRTPPLVSRLAQRLLGHRGGGALAVLGHVDRAWTTSFSWLDAGVPRAEIPRADLLGAGGAPGAQIQVFQSTIHRLLEGHRVGYAMEYVNQQYGSLVVELSHLQNDRLVDGISPDRSRLMRLLRASNDARGFVVVGDPAVRLAGSGSAVPAAL